MKKLHQTEQDFLKLFLSICSLNYSVVGCDDSTTDYLVPTQFHNIVRVFRIHFRFEVSLSPSPHLDISNISFELYFTLELQQQPSLAAVRVLSRAKHCYQGAHP